jgi:hypothetical protein
MTTRLKTVLAELFCLLKASFQLEGANKHFLPFEAYPSSFRPPMRKVSR